MGERGKPGRERGGVGKRGGRGVLFPAFVLVLVLFIIMIDVLALDATDRYARNELTSSIS